jgi:hypothetical protein
MDLPVTLPHSEDELDGKSIRFRVRSAKGDLPEPGIAAGKGTLMIDFSRETKGMFTATIDVTIWPETSTGMVQVHKVPLDQRSVDCIRILLQPEDDVELECLDPALPSDLFFSL